MCTNMSATPPVGVPMTGGLGAAGAPPASASGGGPTATAGDVATAASKVAGAAGGAIGGAAQLGSVSPDMGALLQALQDVTAKLSTLLASLQQSGGSAGAPPAAPNGSDVAGVSGGGPTQAAPGASSGCGCSHGDDAPPPGPDAKPAGAKGAPDAKKPDDAAKKDAPPKKADAPPPASKFAIGGAPKKLSGETSHDGLTDKSNKVLAAAQSGGLKLISGKRNGDPQGHGNGSAIDVSNVPGGSKQGSSEMEAFAEAMRAAGKAGDPNIGYVIYRQRIASARDGWAWRPMEDRGSNTQNHYDHVHVSTDPNR